MSAPSPPQQASSPAAATLGALVRAVAEVHAARPDLERAVQGATREAALELAERVEAVARSLYPLQLLAARAVAESTPATSSSSGLVRHQDGESVQVDHDGAADLEGHALEHGLGGTEGVGSEIGDVAPCPDSLMTITPADPTPTPYRRPQDLLRVRLRIPAAEANRRLRAARELLPRQGMSGQPIAARRERLRSVIDTDGLHPQAALSAVRALEEIQRFVEPEVAADIEHFLAESARTLDPDSLARVASRAVAMIDQDGAAPSEREAAARQGVFIGPTRGGLTELRIYADALQTETLLTVFDAGTNPRTSLTLASPTAGEISDVDDATGGSTPGDAASAGETGMPGGAACTGACGGGIVSLGGGGPEISASASDPDDAGPSPEGPLHEVRAPHRDEPERTRPQKMLDALVAACAHALRASALPDTGGLPTQVLVTMSIEDLRGECGAAFLPHLGPVPVSQVRRLACDADIIPIVLGSEGQVLDLGRSQRLVPAHLRKALIARDGGCAFPGCSIPASWTEGHHIVPWHQGGRTSIDNLVLLCAHHHHLADAGTWNCAISNGVPVFEPPWPGARRWKRNPFHRPPAPGPRVDPHTRPEAHGDARTG